MLWCTPRARSSKSSKTAGQATQYRISVTPTDYGGWDEQVDDLPHVGLGGRTVLALQTTGEG